MLGTAFSQGCSGVRDSQSTGSAATFEAVASWRRRPLHALVSLLVMVLLLGASVHVHLPTPQAGTQQCLSDGSAAQPCGLCTVNLSTGLAGLGLLLVALAVALAAVEPPRRLVALRLATTGPPRAPPAR